MKPVIQTAEDLKELAERIKAQTEPLTWDTETTGLFAPEDRIVGFSIGFSEDEGYYIPVAHRESLNIPERLVVQLFQLMQKKKLVPHNGKFDAEFVRANYGLEMPFYSDTMLMAYIAGFPKLGLKDIMHDYFGAETKEFNELLEEKYGKNWKSQGYCAADLTVEEMYEYAIHDAVYTYRLFNLLKDQMKEYAGIFKMELNLLPIVSQMNLEGLTIDKEKLRQMGTIAKERRDQYIKEMRDVAGESFEPNSSRQCAKVIYEQLNLPVTVRSRKTGAPSTSAEVMEELQYLHPFCKSLQNYRSINKFIGGYLDKLPNIVDNTGLLYANFSSIGADSGRFTCPGTTNWKGEDTTVNLQNQPVDDEFDVRSAYVAPEGWTFVKADYSQIEYRMMNNLAGETAAIEKFKAGVDFHSATAHMMLEIPDDVELTRDQRQIGKVLNFGISYGMVVATVAKMTGHTEAEAQKLYDKYFEVLPKLRQFILYCQEQVRKNKIARTVFGRVRKLEWEGLPSRAAEDMIKKGFNTTVQGSAADILKIAILRVKDRVLDKYGSDKVRLMLTVHDELDFYVKDEYLEEIMLAIKGAMEIPVPDEWCPFVCDLEYGKSWSEKDHVDFVPDASKYQMDKFEGWNKAIPARYQSYLTVPDYVATW